MPSVDERVRLATQETQGAALGDERLNARLTRIIGQVAGSHGASLPKQARSVAALEATYRFLNNEKVSFETILAPHQRATVERIRAAGTCVLVAHDTTELAVNREQMGELNGRYKGFLAHVSLAITADEAHAPLGVVAAENLFRESVGSKRPYGNASFESARWIRGVERARSLLGDTRCIHLMDREGDAYAVMSAIVVNGDDFVIRAQADRLLLANENLRLSEALSSASPVIGRAFPVGNRPRNPSPRHAKRHPPRAAHTAKAEISATTVVLPRPKRSTGADSLRLNVVRVRELGSQGTVEWILWTTLSITTAEEILFVVDAYRARWRIEELFKSLKSGCQFERLQLESRRSITNALALYLPVAWLLLHLRSVSRDLVAAADQTLSPRQLLCLRFLYDKQEGKPLPAVLSARDAMLAVARLGGHLKNNGDPGWITLGRGIHDILMVEYGLMLAQENQSLSKDAINP